MITLRRRLSKHAPGVCGTLCALALLAPLPVASAAETVSNQPLYSREFDAFKNKTLEQKVQELADREEIRELISTYAHRVAHGQAFHDLFTEDGVYAGANSATKGRKNIEEFFNKGRQNRVGLDTPLPQIHNYLIRISGDEAVGLNSNELRITQGGKSIIGSGYYNDKYRRVNGRWLFAERKITWFHQVPIQEGWAKPPPAK